MKTAVMYGAGNIGRGFMGQLFYQSGYRTIFIDIDEGIVSALNARGAYPLRIVSNGGVSESQIAEVSGLLAADKSAVARAITGCDILCTAVGVNVLPNIVPHIAAGIKERAGTGTELNIIICENKIHAGGWLRDMVKQELGPEHDVYIDDKIGFVEASVGRMVPAPTDGMKEGDLLRVWAEPYYTLPVDRAAFKGAIPAIQGMLAESDFEYHIQSKLFLHNMGHSLTAYLGKLNDYTYIYEAVSNENIRHIVRQAMYSSARALSFEHKKPLDDVLAYADDLLDRFGNQYLMDTVERVGRDIRRKLGEHDRLVGAARLCRKHGIDTLYIKLGIAAALLFGEEFDLSGLNLDDI
ncbi:MAG: mannitol dehydrogenase [Oscillospiraceae bacterium]|nr:mannitol dehydrogenase [Oscillospiraceae bacterium]